VRRGVKGGRSSGQIFGCDVNLARGDGTGSPATSKTRSEKGQGRRRRQGEAEWGGCKVWLRYFLWLASPAPPICFLKIRLKREWLVAFHFPIEVPHLLHPRASFNSPSKQGQAVTGGVAFLFWRASPAPPTLLLQWRGRVALRRRRPWSPYESRQQKQSGVRSGGDKGLKTERTGAI
jgi:hypothetical protein